jgi:hypothetical protein
MKSCNYEGNPLEFMHKINDFRLKNYIKKCLENYASKYEVENIQDFELEQICKSIIFIEPKMYVKNVAWDDGSAMDENPVWCKKGTFYEFESNIQAKGVDLVRSSYPKFAREKGTDIVKYYFQNSEDLSDRKLNKMLKSIKEEFKIVAASRIEDVSFQSGMRGYEDKVVDDEENLIIEKATHHAVKSSAFHNYLLHKHPQYKGKYNKISSGDKIKYYYTTSKKCNEFAYSGGRYPYEFAVDLAPIDINVQFDKSILSLVNRFNNVLGLSKVTPELTFTLSVF